MKKIAIFGDSLTAGYDGQNTTDILKRKLAQKLNQKAEIKLFGLCGDDTKRALRRLPTVKNYQADVNLIFFGTNDASASHLVSEELFAENLKVILSQLENYKLLITPPLVNEEIVSSHRSNKRVESYRSVILKIAQEQDLLVADFYQALYDKDQKQYLQADGIHLTPIAYELLSKVIIEKIRFYF